MSKIKNLYIKKLISEKLCSKEQIEQFDVFYKKTNPNATEEDYNKDLEEFKKLNTHRNYQMIKLNTLPFLDRLVRANWDLIDVLNKPLLFTQEQFNEILDKCNISKEVDQIPIFLDSNNILCIIMPTTDKMLDTIRQVDKLVEDNKDKIKSRDE